MCHLRCSHNALQDLPIANQYVKEYNAVLTTKRAGTNRPFFLVVWFWSSKLSEGGLLGVIGFFVFPGIELNTWHCSKSLNKL